MKILNTSVNNKNEALTNMKDTGWTKKIVAFILFGNLFKSVFKDLSHSHLSRMNFMLSSAKLSQMLGPARRAHQTNRGRTPFLCTPRVPIFLSSTVSRVGWLSFIKTHGRNKKHIYSLKYYVFLEPVYGLGTAWAQPDAHHSGLRPRRYRSRYTEILKGTVPRGWMKWQKSKRGFLDVLHTSSNTSGQSHIQFVYRVNRQDVNLRV
jgi:hypothetical protein